MNDNLVISESIDAEEVKSKKFSLKKVATFFFSLALMITGTSSFASAASTDSGMENLGTLFTQITGWITSIVSTITASPILLLGLGIFVVGAIIGLAYRLIRG